MRDLSAFKAGQSPPAAGLARSFKGELVDHPVQIACQRSQILQRLDSLFGSLRILNGELRDMTGRLRDFARCRSLLRRSRGNELNLCSTCLDDSMMSSRLLRRRVVSLAPNSTAEWLSRITSCLERVCC